MALWWIGNGVLAVVVLPAVIWLLAGVLRPAGQIDRLAAGIEEGAGGVARRLEAVPELVKTQQLVTIARGNVQQYGAALQRLLGGSTREA